MAEKLRRLTEMELRKNYLSNKKNELINTRTGLFFASPLSLILGAMLFYFSINTSLNLSVFFLFTSLAFVILSCLMFFSTYKDIKRIKKQIEVNR